MEYTKMSTIYGEGYGADIRTDNTATLVNALDKIKALEAQLYSNARLFLEDIKATSAQRDKALSEVENLKAYAMHERSLGAEPWMMKCHELEQDMQSASTALAEAHQEIYALRRLDAERQKIMVRLQAVEFKSCEDEALLRECAAVLLPNPWVTREIKTKIKKRLGL
jgi:hypothetical protein